MSDVIVDVWPRLGTTVTLASGYVITATGAAVAPTNEITGLMRSGPLLDYDPTQVNPDPSPLPPVEGGGGRSFDTLNDLRSFAGLTDGEVVQLLGVITAGDAGAGAWRWLSGDTTPDNTATVAGALASGRWRRIS